MVADVEKYPEFLPWCRAARILQRDENGFTAELVISFKHFTESYISRVDLMPARGADTASFIRVGMLSGPFDYLRNEWDFTPIAEGGTRIDFRVDFKFKSKLLDMLIGSLFDKATQKMGEAFTARADALYNITARNSLPAAAFGSNPLR